MGLIGLSRMRQTSENISLMRCKLMYRKQYSDWCLSGACGLQCQSNGAAGGARDNKQVEPSEAVPFIYFSSVAYSQLARVWGLDSIPAGPGTLSQGWGFRP
ncbi:hypothetical protein PoB_003081900 [Plakobranchus ocellatus]|uniref:Uncharacterized protein n=1 Tax=Plakobranchus ocellatus TaxID=259542 RepID=A0AAV4AD35_9GAST|nr:hypothetical protein PoB_003081900 [Plakobranchus ocellatus]